MSAAYYTAVGLFAAGCLTVTVWATWKLIAWREGFTDIIAEVWEYLM